jgi:hypothetical protein
LGFERPESDSRLGKALLVFVNLLLYSDLDLRGDLLVGVEAEGTGPILELKPYKSADKSDWCISQSSIDDLSREKGVAEEGDERLHSPLGGS